MRSQTGSGKTLAYAVPIVDALQSINPRVKRQDGVQAIIVVPTRELALQTHEIFTKINVINFLTYTLYPHLLCYKSTYSSNYRREKIYYVYIMSRSGRNDRYKRQKILECDFHLLG